MMHPVLRRQVRRLCNLEDDAALQAAQASLLSLARNAGDTLPAAALPLLRALPELLERVSQTYEQFERDAKLRSRSLELSSEELGQANGRLHAQLQERNQAVRSLRQLIQDANPEGNTAGPRSSELPAAEVDSMAELSEAVVGLVTELWAERAEQASLQALIQRENQRYDAVLSSLTEVVFRLDRHGRITYTNAAWSRITGLDESLGQKLEQYLLESDRAAWRSLLSDLAGGTGSHRTLQARLQPPGQALLWIEARVQTRFDREGSATGFVGTLNDVTRAREASDRLSEQLHFVDTLFQSLPVPAFVKDSNLRFVRLNEAYAALFRLDLREALGRTAEEIGYCVEDENHIIKTREALQTDRPVAFESKLRLRDGRVIEVLASKAALRNAAGELTGLLGTCVDITERKAAGRAMEAAKAAAETANRMKSEFLANMSHEIRTPMNGVIGMTELVLATRLTDQQREYLELVRSSADALMGLLNEILDFSKIEAGKMTIERISLDIQRILMEIMRTLAPRVRDGRVRLVLDIDPHVPGRLLGDPARLRQVLHNLLGNAIKFTREGEIVTTVRVVGERQGRVRLSLSVRDTGIGISAQQLERIFTPFTQEDASITRRFGGTGLGLSITERLVTMMGGRISVNSEAGRGSEFTVELEMELEGGPRRAPSLSRSLPDSRILVAHEGGTQRDILVRVLQGSGAEVFVADEAHAGVQGALRAWRAQAQPFQVLIVSTEVDPRGGLAWVEDWRAALADFQGSPPVLLMMGRLGTMPERSALSSAGVVGSILTPCAPREIHAVVLQAVLGEVCNQGQGLTGESALALAPATAQAPTPPTGARILLAEDHEVNQVLGMALLGSWGHQVVLAADGRQAVDAWARESFDLVLMDMQMPELSGLDATREIRRLEAELARPRIPIVALTANAMESDRQRCLEAGMDDHLAKPLRAADLQRVLDRHLQAARPAGEPTPESHLQASFDYAAALREVEPELLQFIGLAFVRNCPVEFDRLRQAIAAAQAADFERTAHSLKGLFQGFGAKPLAQACAALERLAAAQPAAVTDPTRAAGLSASVHAIAAAAAAFLQVLESASRAVAGHS